MNYKDFRKGETVQEAKKRSIRGRTTQIKGYKKSPQKGQSFLFPVKMIQITLFCEKWALKRVLKILLSFILFENTFRIITAV